MTIPEITDIPMLNYPTFRPYTNVQPFTVGNARTYLIQLETLIAWIKNDLVPHIDSEISELTEAWETQTIELIAAWEQMSAVLIARIEQAEAEIGTAVDDAQAAQAAAEAARDLAELYASQAQAIQDVAINTIVTDTDSVTRTTLDGLYAALPAFQTLELAVNAISGEVATKAEQSDLAALAARVTDNDADIADLDATKAEKTDLAALDTEVAGLADFINRDALANQRADATAAVGARRVQVTNEIHAAFPGLAMLSDGRLALVWRSATSHSPLVNGIVKLAYSSDGGNTWTNPVTIFTDANDDLRDPSISFYDGVLYLTLFKHNGTIPVGVFLSRSNDLGATWQPLTRIDNSSTAAVCAPLVKTGTSTLLIPYYGKQNGSETYDSAYVLRSPNNGATWTTHVIAPGSARDYQEPYIVALPTAVVAFFRYGNALAIGRAESVNGGQNWTSPVSVIAGGGGKPASVVDGKDIVMTYRRLADGAAVTRVSSDQGNTWGPEVFVDKANVWMAYAAMVTVVPGLVATAYALEQNMGSDIANGDSEVYLRYFTTRQGSSPLGDYNPPTPERIQNGGQVRAYDDFDRPNGPVGVSASGHLWAAANLVIDNGRIAPAAAGIATGIIDTGANDADITGNFVFTGQSGIGIILRYVNANTFLLATHESSGAIARIYKFQSGTPTMLKEVTLTADDLSGVFPGTPYKLRATAKNNYIKMYVDDHAVMVHGLSVADIALFSSSTQHGVRMNLQTGTTHYGDDILFK